MSTRANKCIPVLEGAWTTPSSKEEKPRLVASRCPVCSEIFFPKRALPVCAHCQNRGLEEIKLSRRGRVFSFSVVMQPPGGGMYHGMVPYAFGMVELPEGALVESLLVADDLDYIRIGMEVELAIEKVWDDGEGSELESFVFRPVPAEGL